MKISYTSDTDNNYTAGIGFDVVSRRAYNCGEINNGDGNSKNGKPIKGIARYDDGYSYYHQGKFGSEDDALLSPNPDEKRKILHRFRL